MREYLEYRFIIELLLADVQSIRVPLPGTGNNRDRRLLGRILKVFKSSNSVDPLSYSLHSRF